ncbi:hypothetical protein B0T10DRAFT_524292 [Thelonectria olida]|uniref:Major facilitator superfamily (MFS) profile domain-containing protein n=1 Tax=Thelonectria olida TaxID=1576542 RepID=A0A9P8VQA6_9HYPO|nr:hypothetical protein B0T10DRAFT_524292 [Thelonectria olida]
MNDVQLRATVRTFHENTTQTLTGLRPYPTEQEVQDAAMVWKHRTHYETAARANNPTAPVELNEMERRALVNEVDHTFSERGMWIVILTSSQNGSNFFAFLWIDPKEGVDSRFSLANAAVYFSAAGLGCPLAAPLNSVCGRRGVIFIASFLICAASLGSAAIPLDGKHGWALLSGIRVIGGVGMGLKAVSTPILAAETAVGYWRGSFVLVWQLWYVVSFGIMTSFIVNICLNGIHDPKLKLRLILGSPAIFALALMLLKAFGSLMRLRNTKFQATRDLFLTHMGIEEEIMLEQDARQRKAAKSNPSSTTIIRYVVQYWEILMTRRLRNAAVASGVVALSQQLSGINIMAFYGGSILVGSHPGQRLEGDKLHKAMVYNVIFGMLNFLFCLPAIRYIDSIGRRKTLLYTIPWMAVGLMAAALSIDRVKIEIVAFWIYFHTIWYSPGMGPVPFILAAESFPLAFREAGASIAIAVNFLCAGILAWLHPLLTEKIKVSGTLGLFAGLNMVAMVLIFLLVEETGGVRLEALGLVFREKKRDFMRFQVCEFLPWLGKLFIRKSKLENQPKWMVNCEQVEEQGGVGVLGDEVVLEEEERDVI